MNRRMVEELAFNCNHAVRVGKNGYVFTHYINDYCIDEEDYKSMFDMEDFNIQYDFTMLGGLTSSFATTYIFVDKNTFKLKAFTDNHPDTVVDLDWNVTEYIDDMYIDLALKVESILKEKYGCREVTVCVLEGYYTRKELLQVLDNVMYYN